MRLFILSCLFAALAATQGIAAEEFKYEKKIQSLVDPYLKHKKINALSVGVISNGQIWTHHYGTLDGKGTPAPDNKTIYEIGSISKVFTSLLLAEAVVSGQLKLDDPIGTVMEELDEKNPKLGTKITFKQLSHHTSGLPRMPTNFKPADPTNPFADYDRKMLTDFLMTAKPAREPDAGFEYSNLAVGLLGDLLSRQSGISYEALLKKKLTGPLKMTDTSLTLSPKQVTRLAPPHNAALLPDQSWDFGSLAGCGAIRSNLDDMLLFAEASLNPSNEILKKPIELAWKEQKPPHGAQLAMGLGWMIAQDRSTRWHNGQTGGYECMILINRPLKSAAVILCNTAGSKASALGEQIFQTIVGMDTQPKKFDAEIKVDPKIVKRLEGNYQLAPGFVLTVKVKEGRMMAQLTGQQFLVLVPKSKTEWKYQAVDATLKFELPKTGKSPKVTLHQAGRVMPCKRLNK